MATKTEAMQVLLDSIQSNAQFSISEPSISNRDVCIDVALKAAQAYKDLAESNDGGEFD